ncbi:N-acetylmuramoyl-L-alanine amidase AmiC precursor [compost metagenome]
MPRNRLLMIFLAAALSGCAHVARADGVTYAALQDALPAADWQGLKGRRIVLDAGHGGKEPGAVGPGGLKEKDVNLAVTLELAKLLRQAGAEVLLTRDTDKDMSLPDRVTFSNAKDPDLFVSIHHNATLEPKNQLDETQTYYKMDDAGPSYEVGAAIHRRLIRNLAMPKERLAPGNYFVLRYSKAPAILGEASYISHPDVERKLGTKAAVLLEAQSYFLGISEYFKNGRPTVKTFAKQEGSDPSRPVIVAQLDGDGSPVAPASITMTLNDKKLPVSYDPLTGAVIHQPTEPLPNGSHVVTLSFRNVKGNSAPKAEALITVNNPAVRATLANPLGAPPQNGRMPLVARFEDVNGNPVADGTPVTWKATSGQFTRPISTTQGGKSINYLENLDPKTAKTVSVSATVAHATVSVTVDTAPKPALMGYVTSKDGKVISGARVVAIGAEQRFTATSNEDGTFWFTDVPAKLTELRVERPGYKPLAYSLRQKAFVDLQMEPVHDGAFLDQVIVLNPAGGGDERGPVSDRAYQASALNWQIADALREYLETAGAKVVLTRDRDDMVSEIQRVRVANEAGATLFLTVALNSEGEDDFRVEHYPSSTKGKQLSDTIRLALERALGAKGQTKPYASYALIHPACPSVTIVPGPLNRYDGALLPAQTREAAYAIFQGLQPQKAAAGRLKVKLRYRSGESVPNATATLDTRLTGLTDAKGTWDFENLDLGQHHLTVSDGHFTRSLWVIDLGKDESREIEVILDQPELPDHAG